MKEATVAIRHSRTYASNAANSVLSPGTQQVAGWFIKLNVFRIVRRTKYEWKPKKLKFCPASGYAHE